MQIIFPRSHKFSLFCEIVNDVNVELGNLCSLYQILFLKPNDEWLQANRKLNLQLFWKYDLHLSKTGYLKLATSLFSFISSCSTSNSTSFDLRKIKKLFLYCQKATSTFPPRRASIILKNISLLSVNIFINQLHNVYMFVKFLNLFLNFICVVSSAFFFPPVLVNQF